MKGLDLCPGDQGSGEEDGGQTDHSAEVNGYRGGTRCHVLFSDLLLAMVSLESTVVLKGGLRRVTGGQQAQDRLDSWPMIPDDRVAPTMAG